MKKNTTGNSDLYADLGVDRDATADQVKRAYLKKAKAAHPDAGGSTAAFQKIGQAYRVLSAPDKRAQYDRDGTIDDGADNSAIAALNIITQLMEEMIEAAAANLAIDPVDKMRQILGAKVDEITRQLPPLRANVKKLQELAKRFRSKHRGRNLLRDITLKRIAAIESNIAEGEAVIARMKIARKMLDDYSFEVDAPPASYQHQEIQFLNFSDIGSRTA